MFKRPSRLGRHPLQRGLTLIESAVGTAIVAFVTSQVAPAFTAAAMKHHLEGMAATVRNDLQYTRLQAVALNQPVHLTLDTQTGAGCYVVHTGAANQCQCANTHPVPVCTGQATSLRVVKLLDASGVRLETTLRSLTFDPVKGTSTPAGTIKLQSKAGPALHHIVNIVGRVRTCTPTAAWSGYPMC